VKSVQGANDPNVTPENLHVVEAALKRVGVPYETLAFADAGHGVRKPENLRVLYQRLIAFFGPAFADWRPIASGLADRGSAATIGVPTVGKGAPYAIAGCHRCSVDRCCDRRSNLFLLRFL
jgi:prolyl oligopeptidase family protein